MSAIVLDHALALAKQRVRLFPILPNSKKPAITGFPVRATSGSEQLHEFFGNGNYNLGIACGKIMEGYYLVGFDIDRKAERDGFYTLDVLEQCEGPLPPTWAQRTPSGGEHRLFWSPVPIVQGTDIPGRGIDLRGEGGYLVGPGSQIDGKHYLPLNDLPIARAPQWLIDGFQRVATVHRLNPQIKGRGTPVENQVYALKQAIGYLFNQDPVYEGSRSDAAFRVAAQLKDFGLAREQAVDVLLEHWECLPMLDLRELETIVSNAYAYGKNPIGSAAPENLFEPVKPEEVPPPPPPPAPEEDFLDELNKTHFYIAEKGTSRVWEETEIEGVFHLEGRPVDKFHELHLANKVMHHGKEASATRLWMASAKRRTYRFMRFYPGQLQDPTIYNTWRGFEVKPSKEPLSSEGAEGVRLFLDHVENNVCRGNKEHTKWLLGYMAHLFQRPQEKPEVAVALIGKKGTGKTIISDILRGMIGHVHSIVVSDKTHALGHFNSVMENKLLVTLDEAFWSGEKALEGVLKTVITGKRRIVTLKNMEGREVPVYDRIFICSNEDWAVPASGDERRFAVFRMSSEHAQDQDYFGAMMDGLFKHGGAAGLMQFFLDYDLAGVNVDRAPKTEALNEQKQASLGVFDQWWLGCLEEGRVPGTPEADWPEFIASADLPRIFQEEIRRAGHRGFAPQGRTVQQLFTRVCCPSRNRNGVRGYVMPPLAELRARWVNAHGYGGDWLNE